jgi:hypothetical protein
MPALPSSPVRRLDVLGVKGEPLGTLRREPWVDADSQEQCHYFKRLACAQGDVGLGFQRIGIYAGDI